LKSTSSRGFSAIAELLVFDAM